MSDLAVSRADIETAYALIRTHIRRTPVIEIAATDLGLGHGLPPISFKLEQLQLSGSFKARGALYNLISRDVPEAGVVTASGGNHGAALALAAKKAGVPANIFAFSFIPQAKAALIRSFGAKVHPAADDFDRLMELVHAFSAETGAMLVHAYDQPATLTGQGTTALEFMEQAEFDTILVATGGGGLIGGIAACLEDHVRIVSVEPENCPHLHAALKAGGPVEAPSRGIAADSLGPRKIGSLVYPIAERFVDAAVLVPDEAIDQARRLLWRALRIVVEPGGATALAALICGAYQPASDERLGILLCGANTGVVDFG